MDFNINIEDFFEEPQRFDEKFLKNYTDFFKRSLRTTIMADLF